jgi:TPR repeat protein
MSLENVPADASLERNEYHKLELYQLNKLDDAEALYQIADRIMEGIGVEENKELGWGIVIEAARRGHAVALARCFRYGQGVEKNEARAVDLFRASADRGHASGTRTNLHSNFQTQFSRFFLQLNTGWLNAISTAMELR